MMFSRADRLKELFKEELIRALRGVKDPGLSGFLTITDVSLSPDRKTANVYYSILGSPRERESAGKALERAAPYIRQVLKKRLTIKMVPHFIFVYDETPQKASRVDKLFIDLESEKGH
jgi:ribosome-binding factor A